MSSFFILNLLLFPIYIKNTFIEPCLAVQECKTDLSTTNSKVKCSEFGKCFFDLYNYVIQKKKNNNIEFLKCVCDDGYITLNNDDEVKCCYKQKLQLNAFLFELILSFGLGHKYIGRNNLFWSKFCVESTLIILIVICFCFYSISNKNKNNYELNYQDDENNIFTTKEMILNALSFISFNIIMIWQIIDIILYGINFYNDENGIPLKKW